VIRREPRAQQSDISKNQSSKSTTLLSLVAAKCLLVVTLFWAGISACASQYPVNQVPELLGPAPGRPDFTSASEPEYLIQTGDVLEIQSYYDASLREKVTVRPDGRISVVFLGDVVAAGKTPRQLSDELHDGYAKELVAKPDIVVTVDTTVGQVVYVGGEVKAPTIEEIKGSLTLLQSVVAAGGFLPTANEEQIIIIRAQGEGQFRAYQRNADMVLNNKSSDLYLRPHDIIFVPKTRIAQVDQYVDQYVNQIIPRAVVTNFGYTFFNSVGSNTTVQTVPAGH
jgi:protein involved in polysaccharide export with SLBB domain